MNFDPVEIPDTTTQKKRDNSWDETIKTVIFAVLLALTFRSFLYEPFHIPSGSMKNNLLVGDYLFVSKFSYGYSRYSFPLGLPIMKGRVFGDAPKRGDVVVFRYPPNPRIDYIKRLIGLPGDKIQVRGGIVYINGKPLPREQQEDFVDNDGGNGPAQLIARFSETLPEGKSFDVLKSDDGGPANNTKLFEVPAGHYFMMGDNRDNSRDSRFEVGYVPEENLVGRAEIVFFSANTTAKLLDPTTWMSSIRMDRFFKLIY